MIFTSYHTHTARCKHADGEDREYLDCAVRSGYQVLGFTDHMAWPFSSGFSSPVRMEASQLEEYASAILRLKEEYAPRIRVHLGAECEYFPDYLPWLLEQKERLGLEYLILGMHYPPNEAGFEPFANAAAPDRLLEYTEWAVSGMESGMFAYLCHPDLPLKSYPRFDRYARRMCEELCAAAQKLDLPLEYNLAGLRLRESSPGFGYTSQEFWQIAGACRCRAVIASDAHQPQVLEDTGGFRRAREHLDRLGSQVLDYLPGLE